MTETNRKSRTQETRAADERVHEWEPPSKRITLQGNEEFQLRWVRESARGADDLENMEKRRREGYETVSPEDPMVREQVAMGTLTAQGGKIVRGGLVLMKFPRKFAQQRNQYYTEQADLHQQAVSEALNNVRHKSMPLTEDLERK